MQHHSTRRHPSGGANCQARARKSSSARRASATRCAGLPRITWNGRLSQKGCPDGEGAAAKAGRYDLTGRNGSVTSDSTPFALTNAD